MVVRIVFYPAFAPRAGASEIVLGEVQYGQDIHDAGTGLNGSVQSQLFVVAASADLQMHVYFQGAKDPEEARRRAMREILFARFAADLAELLATGDTVPGLGTAQVLSAADVGGGPPAVLKQCTFQRREPAGLFCNATQDSASSETSIPLCNTCRLPSDNLRCTALVHPKIDWPGDGVERQPTRARCDAGRQDVVGDGSDCRVGGNSCWHRDIEIVQAPIEIPSPELAGDLLVDEFDHLRLALKQRLGRKMPRGSGELRIGASLAKACKTREELAARIQALASLIEVLNVTKPAAAARIAVPEDAKSLAAMSAVLAALDITGVEDDIATLLAVTRFRNLAPAHPKFDDAVYAVARFGITLPIEDYSDAWLRIADGARRALRNLRIKLQDGNGEEGNERGC